MFDKSESSLAKNFVQGCRSGPSMLCSQGSEPREHGGEYVCMLRKVCPGVSKSTEDIRVRTTVWVLQLIGNDQF